MAAMAVAAMVVAATACSIVVIVATAKKLLPAILVVKSRLVTAAVKSRLAAAVVKSRLVAAARAAVRLSLKVAAPVATVVASRSSWKKLLRPKLLRQKPPRKLRLLRPRPEPPLSQHDWPIESALRLSAFPR